MKESNRTYPDVSCNTISPSDDIPLLEFYNGYYDCVYVMLHPFVKITHPEQIDFERKWPAKQGWPTKGEITKFTKKVSWTEILKLSDFKDIHQLDIALRTMIGGLNDRNENKQDADKLTTILSDHQMIMPGEGLFSDSLIDDMLKAAQSVGHEWIFIGDEFGHERKLEFSHDIIDNKLNEDYYRKNWYTPQNEILFTTHWDSHFTLLCSDQATVKTIIDKYSFEGFYCKPYTQVYWSIHNK